MERATPIFAVDTFKSLGDKAFRGQSMFGVIMTWIMLICVIIGLLFIGRVIQSEDQKSQLSQLHQTTELWAETFSIRLNSDLDRLSQLQNALPVNLNFSQGIDRLQHQARDLAEKFLRSITLTATIASSPPLPRPCLSVTLPSRQATSITERELQARSCAPNEPVLPLFPRLILCRLKARLLST